MWDSAKTVPSHVKPLPHHPSYIRTLISQKSRARAIWQRSRYPLDKSHYNTLTQKLKRLLANLKSESYANYTSSLTGIDCSLWKATKNYYASTILHLLYVMLIAAGHYLNNLKLKYLQTTYQTLFNHTIILSHLSNQNSRS